MDFAPSQPAPQSAGLRVPSVGGIMSIRSLAQLQQEERRAAELVNAKPYITNLAAHIRTQWAAMKTAKLQTVEPRLLQCLRQRRGEYDPDKAALIKEQGGADIYMMLSSNKARAASSWIRDVVSGRGTERPWSANPTPIPDLPPDRKQMAYQEMAMEVQQALAVGLNPSPSDVRQYMEARKQMMLDELREEARASAERMAAKMEDQHAEGGFFNEFDKFIDDLVTFPFAVMKGPVVKRRKAFQWAQGADGQWALQLRDELLPTWERVDPFMLYWSAQGTRPDDCDLIERHRLTRASLQALIGVEGYNEGAIRAVLDAYGLHGLQDWLWVDAAKATAEGKSLSAAMQNPDGLIDALQFWGSVQGKLLIDWGIDPEEIEDPDLDYQVEAWLIGSWVVKAVINPDPLGRKPYFKTSYEEIPGAWMGNGVMDLVRDCQNVCNAAARALVSNMGIASGPQVYVNVDRLPDGEKITQMYPWKIWQVRSDPMGSTAPPVDFFQPASLAAELMGIYEKFSVLADEYSGVPRYMTGDSPTGGAGRTASGMNMLMNNAGKAIKQVIANIDRYVLTPLIERQWFHNMRFVDDPDLKGDVKVTAMGARSLIVKEAAAQRRNELLQMALGNPIAQQIMGMDGTAHLLREQVAGLDMNADRIVPNPTVVKARAMVAQAQQMMAMAQGGGTPPPEAPTGGARQRAAEPVSNPNQNLATGAPVNDQFSPMRQA